jgi:hypothetical protein
MINQWLKYSHLQSSATKSDLIDDRCQLLLNTKGPYNVQKHEGRDEERRVRAC